MSASWVLKVATVAIAFQPAGGVTAPKAEAEVWTNSLRFSSITDTRPAGR